MLSLAPPVKARLIIDGSLPGARNMAVDESLLIEAAENGSATLRFYAWKEPTLSLGYFQRYSDREQHAASRDCTVVRRQTGGGAILHDRELTYSLAVPPSHPLAKHTEELYHTVHQAFIETLSQMNPHASPGWKILLRGHSSDQQAPAEPFLCFERKSPGDVIMVPAKEPPAAGPNLSTTTPFTIWKVLGSAQRRYHGAVLQHGSLLLARSPSAPELPGVSDLIGLTVAANDVAFAVRLRVESALGTPLLESTLPAELESRAAELTNNKYGSSTWTKRR